MIQEFYEGIGCGIVIGVFMMWLFILIKEQQKKKQEDFE